MGAGRARSVAAMGRRTGGAARRRVPSDDAVHGARGGGRYRGCGRTVAMSRGSRSGRYRGGVAALRTQPQGTDIADPANVAAEHVDARADRSLMALWV